MSDTNVYVIDVDSILDGSARRLIEQGEISGRIVIHKSVIEYFYSEAKSGRSTGFTGLEELRKIVHDSPPNIEIIIAEEGRLPSTPTLDEVKRLIRDYAWKSDATLVSSDLIQIEAARALGVNTFYSGTREAGTLRIERYFTRDTMSVHIKEGSPPVAKVGKPGDWRFKVISPEPLSRTEVEDIAREIIEVASRMENGFIEIDRAGSTIVQLGDYRIVITRPPLSDGWEITAVRPIAKLHLEDYNLPDKLMKRLIERAEGILIAGAPGMGKTTFAQALAEFYASLNRIVKTIESPRDMRLPPSITQYSKNYADLGELHDILLLSRPDYTVFDELRNDEDFRLYVDLRLAGIGMIGVVHATTPIDAVQRFIRRVELGMIPNIIDTIIFIDRGTVSKVYDLSITVKLPTGLKEAELSRPVVEIRDFLTGDLEYEIYTFGEQTMVVPVKERRADERSKLESAVRRILPEALVEIEDGVLIVRVPRGSTRLTARRLRRIKKLAEKHGYDVRFVPMNAW